MVCAKAATCSPPSTVTQTTHIQNINTGTSPSDPYSLLIPNACSKYAESIPFNPMITTLAQKAPMAAHCGRTRAAGTTRYTVSSSAQSTPTFHTVPSSATIQPMPGVVPAPRSTAESSGMAAMSSGLAVSTNQYSTNRRSQVRPCRARKTRLKLSSMLVISQMALRTVTLTPTQPSALRSISDA